MNRNWQSAVSLGSVWWIICLGIILAGDLELIAPYLETILEIGAMSIGITYIYGQLERIIKLDWRLVVAELGIMAMIVYLTSGAMTAVSTLLLGSETPGSELGIIANNVSDVMINPVANWKEWSWMPVLLLKSVVMMGLPVLVVKAGGKVLTDLRGKKVGRA